VGGVALPVVVFAGEVALLQACVCYTSRRCAVPLSALLLASTCRLLLSIHMFSALFPPAGLILISRIGIWSFDMVNSQLFQQTVAPREIASASSAEMALCR
jgi:iron-regulated transporter 1